jgi:AraC-like DNA-binding protein
MAVIDVDATDDDDLGHAEAIGALADAAVAAGFADQSRMTRAFRDAFGISPGKWRKLHL